MDDLPDPTTFVLEPFNPDHISYIGRCSNCPGRYRRSHLSEYYIEGFTNTSLTFKCSQCRWQIVVDDDYRRRCKKVVKAVYKKVYPTDSPISESELMGVYVEYYDNFGASTKPAKR